MSAAAVPTRVPRIDRSMSSSQQRITPLFLGQKGAAQSAAGCPAVRSRNNMWPTRDEAARTACAPGLGWTGGKPTRFFYFYIFYFRFLQKYIFDLEIYINIPRPPGSWTAGANLQKKYNKKLQTGPWGPVARLRGGRPYFLQFSPFREIISHMFTFL